MALTLSSRREAGVVTITVGGDIDLSTADDLGRHLAENMAGDVGTVEVDLAEVRFVDSVGINALVTARRRAGDEGKTFRVVEASGLVRETLELTGVWDYLSDAVG